MSPHPILVGTVSMVDSIILMIMALVVFGPRRLPQIGRQLGKLMYEFRKASNDFKFQMEEELRNAEEADRRKKEEERQRSLAALAATDQASVSADPPAKPLELSPAAESPDASALPATETTPRIMPPSIGETVAAERPNRGPASELPTESPSADSPSTSQIEDPAASTPSTDSAEALNHHG
jgi:sec-independent protein translocase protein TatB